MKKNYYLWIFLILIQMFAGHGLYAQRTGVLTGTVTDESGVSVPGATVIVKGTSTGTVSGEDGKFTINVSPEAVLQVSSLGYESREVNVGNQAELSVILNEEATVVDEIVVVGYGTQKKVNLTGSVESVSGKELAGKPVMNTMQALQGVASGVTITSTSGQPGKENESIRIRGIGTLNNNDPLVLVDGIVSSINSVSSTDIESISILKDAASSAIYGSRAANGVVLITTKRAAEGGFRINFSSNVGLQTLVAQPDFLGAIDYLELYDLAFSNDTRNPVTGAPGGVMYGRDFIDNYKARMLYDPYNYPDTDWQKVVYKQPAVQHMHNLTLSGGTEKLRALASLNVADQEGVFPNTYMKRYNFRVNTDYKFSKKVSAGVDISGRHSIVSEPGPEVASILGAVRRTAPIYPWITPGGNPTYPAVGVNAWAAAQEDYKGYNRSLYQEAIINLKAAYEPIDALRLEVSYSPKLNWDSNKVFNNIIPYHDVDENPIDTGQTRGLVMTKNYTFTDDVKFLVNFNKSVKDHNFQLLAGFQQLTSSTESLRGRREGSEFTYDQMDAFPEPNQTTGGSATEWALQSVFGRFNYDYAGKYLFEANLRYDGSSRFAKGYKWGLFPSFSAGWRISEENFMKDLRWFNNAKLRVSWGSLGNQEIGNYPFSMDINLAQPMIFNQLFSQGYAAVAYAFQDLSWETTTMTNVGVDLGFLRNRLNVTFDYYYKKTTDILMNLPISSIMGYATKPWRNAGVVENKGWDFSISWNDRVGDFSYSVTANLSDVKNKILDMRGIIGYDVDSNPILINMTGHPINSIYGLQADSLFPSFAAAQAYTVQQYGNMQGGDVKYRDQLTVDTNGDGIPDAGDGQITLDDYVIIGSTIPRYTFSLNLATQYKGFDLSLFFQGVGKRDGYLREDLAWAFNNGAKVQQWQKDGMWKEGETNSKYPRMFIGSENNIKPSTFWKQNAAYVRLKNLQFGYTVLTRRLERTFIHGVRVYFSAQNLFTIHNMVKGYDPEQDPTFAQNTLPLLRTFSLGFNLDF